MRYEILTRTLETPDGTMGRLRQWHVLEEENQGNRTNISSIPPAAYICKRVLSPKFGNTFEVTGVPGRSEILFHSLNTEEGTKGCIGLGLDVGFLKVRDEDSGEKTRKLAVLNSRIAHRQFMEHFNGVNEWILIVKDFE